MLEIEKVRLFSLFSPINNQSLVKKRSKMKNRGCAGFFNSFFVKKFYNLKFFPLYLLYLNYSYWNVFEPISTRKNEFIRYACSSVKYIDSYS
jgi:hypothetical protein